MAQPPLLPKGEFDPALPPSQAAPAGRVANARRGEPDSILGFEAFHTPLCPAGHLPLKGGDRLSAAPSPTSSVAGRAAKKAAGSISPLEGEMSGRTEGGVKGWTFPHRSFSIKMLQHRARPLRRAAAPLNGSRLSLRSAGMTVGA